MSLLRSTLRIRARIFDASSSLHKTVATTPWTRAKARFILTGPPPNPFWQLGSGASTNTPSSKAWNEQEKDGWTTWNMQEMDMRDAYTLMTSAVIPRPIAFVSSLSEEGVPNLAPFSYFAMVGHNPPMLSVSFSLSPRRPKDTRENILATKEFVVNIISEPFIEAANATCVEAPEEVDEWKLSGLGMVPSDIVKLARVRESAVSFECTLHSSHDIQAPNSPPTTTLVLGLIKKAHIRNAVLSADKRTVDAEKLQAMSRLGGLAYARVGEKFELKRPSWREEVEGWWDDAVKR
ncbi:hypothetical protein BDV98DRAFT_578144 [Pterulicium gracile]|uniref:Flavin reductase like domain-containing protein n=1 Tax=Pterulicium gracile TaxID=1884261 RepID=A0A5C3Q490_9AGAR|nr:hypothetical protein BDV98DRAFT_578144 [Pterula gracilis]